MLYELSNSWLNSQGNLDSTAPISPSIKSTTSQIAFRALNSSAQHPTTTSLQSLSITTIPLDEKKVLEEKDAALWECVGRERDPVEGYLYEFRFRREFLDSDNDVDFGKAEQKQLELSPAVEPLPHQFAETYAESATLLKELGFEILPKNCIKIPDRECLLSRWNKLGLPKINIASSEGIASDTEFVLALMKCDRLLSNGREFMHDAFVHVIPLILNIHLSSKTYEMSRTIFQEYIKKAVLFYEKLDNEDVKKQVAKIIGCIVDVETSGRVDLQLRKIEEIIRDDVEEIFIKHAKEILKKTPVSKPFNQHYTIYNLLTNQKHFILDTFHGMLYLSGERSYILSESKKNDITNEINTRLQKAMEETTLTLSDIKTLLPRQEILSIALDLCKKDNPTITMDELEELWTMEELEKLWTQLHAY